MSELKHNGAIFVSKDHKSRIESYFDDFRFKHPASCINSPSSNIQQAAIKQYPFPAICSKLPKNKATPRHQQPKNIFGGLLRNLSSKKRAEATPQRSELTSYGKRFFNINPFLYIFFAYVTSILNFNRFVKRSSCSFIQFDQLHEVRDK